MTTHGKTNTKLHGVWNTMKNRCSNPNVKSFKDYGGRGIKVCEEWRNDFSSFYEWAIKNGYLEGLEIDRINNDGHYEPNNCQWTTRAKNINKTRKTVYIPIDGVLKTASEWSKESGISGKLILDRHNKGWKNSDLLIPPKIGNNQQTQHQDVDWVKDKTWKPVGMTKTNTSGCVGVHWHKKHNKWQSSITIEGKVKYLGLHEDKNDAISARKNAELLYPEYFKQD